MKPLIELTRIEGYEAVRLRSSSAHVDAALVPSAGMVGAPMRERERGEQLGMGDRPVPVAFGFPPYLHLPNVARERWQVELPAMRHLELDARSIPTGASRALDAQSGPLGSRAFDDAYIDVPEGAEFVLAGGGRRVTVRLEQGYPAAQVFAPCSVDVVCFEPMTAPTNALVAGDGLAVVAPGERHRATFSITVESGAW